MAFSAIPGDPEAVTSGYSGLEGVYDLRRKWSLSDKIVALDRRFAIFDYRLRAALKKVTVDDPEPKTLYRHEMPIKFALAGNSSSTNYENDTLQVTDALAKFIQPGDVFMVPQVFCDSDGSHFSTTKYNSGYKPETVIVTYVGLSEIQAGTAKVLVRRGNGQNTSAPNAGVVTQLTSSNTLIRMVNSIPSGGEAPSPYDYEPASIQNYLQFFSKTWGEDEQYTNTGLYGKETMAQRGARKRRDLLREIENSLFWGRMHKDSLQGKPRWFTGGIVEFVADATQALDGESRFINFNGVFDLHKFYQASEIIFRYGNEEGRKWFFTGGKFITELYNKLSSYLVYNDKIRKAWDINVWELDVGHGVFEIMRHPLLTEMSTTSVEYALDAIIVDPDYVELMVLKNMDIKVRSNIQKNRIHAKENEIYGQVGLYRMHPTAHAVIFGMQEAT